jgi:hypothetical protein
MKNGEEPAYPQSQETKEYFTKTGTFAIGSGLTKREYFAAMAMQGWISCQHEGFTGDSEGYARMAIKAADALLEELSKPKTTEK